jgi:cell shape-determining protein MreC
MKFKKNKSIIFLFIFIIFIFLVFAFFRKSLIQKYTQIYSNLSKNQEINLSLQESVNLLTVQINSLKEENKRLENELSLNNDDTSKIPLRSIAKNSSLYGNFYLEKPENINFYIGMYVYGRDNIIIGTIEEIFENSVRVSFLAQQQKLITEIIERNEILEIESSGVGMYKGLIPKSSEIQIGDTATLKSSMQSIIGNVVAIDEDNTSIKTIWIRAPYNISKNYIFYVSI